MASKKTATRSAPDRSRKAKEFQELMEKARDEVATLLKQEKARDLTGRELQTGLEELQENMKRMLAFKKAPL
jgi:acyl-CoA reductase-like NAD-dependent aldehyde dehydrogenase